ncbi:MAG: thioredoxin family protein [Planctomycetota bacterium]|jgi:hypothetical protein|nr:thioredoxin family protein [Planctomycetota bacterium]
MFRARRLVAALFPLLAANVALAAGVAWQPLDFDAAGRKAEAEGKLIYVFVEGDNCPPCQAFKESHLGDPAFIDFVNSLYVPLRAHEDDPAVKSFLEALRLTHGAVPRFYVLTSGGKGVSMSVGMTAAPPMGCVSVLAMALGRELPVNRAAASALAGRLRAHAANRRAAGGTEAANPLRFLGLAALEAQAWALAGRLDEAEKAFGAQWAGKLQNQEVREWYVMFWLGWRRNLPGALAAARIFRAASPEDPAGALLLGRALAANRLFPEAVREGETYLAAFPGDPAMMAEIENWRRKR